MKGPTSGLSQQAAEAEGSLTLEAQGRVGSSPDNNGTGRHRQTAWARLVPSMYLNYRRFSPGPLRRLSDCMVLFLTQISTIPREILEAAQLDGANVWQQDVHVTVPAIRRAVALWALFLVGYVLRMFEYPFVMTDGGPENRTMNLSLYVYNQMVTANQYGLAMAAGVVTVVLGAALMTSVLLVLRWMERS